MKPNKDERPIPDVEVYARPLGQFTWTCPNCSKFHARTWVPWRNGRLECSSCRHSYRMGVGFNYVRKDGAQLLGKYEGHIANRLNPAGDPATGRLHGRMEWLCPLCSKYHLDRVEGDWLFCQECATPIYVNLLLYEAITAKPVAPYDWCVPHDKETSKRPAAAAPPRSRARTASRAA